MEPQPALACPTQEGLDTCPPLCALSLGAQTIAGITEACAAYIDSVRASSAHSVTLSDGSVVPVALLNGINPMVLAAKKFDRWVKMLDPKALSISRIIVQAVVYFSPAPTPSKLGFVLAEVVATDPRKDGAKVPGIVFIRGASAAIQIIADCDDGEQYVVLVRQMRIPAGRDCYEIPAGIVEDDDTFASAVMRETSEETGIKIDNVRDCQYLGNFMPSPGGCDETIELYTTRICITRAKIDELESGVHGKVGEDEAINVRFIPCKDYGQSLYSIGDCKAEIAYRRSVDQGLFPWVPPRTPAEESS